MAKKLGIDKPVSDFARAHAETVEHKHVPGRAYEINDPVQKLLHTIGGGFFNEPQYYDENRAPVEFYAELLSTGRISSSTLNSMGLNSSAQEIIETCNAIANGPTPEDLLIIASWARDPEKGLRLRYTPQICLVIAARNEKTRKYVPYYAPKIMQRADEIRQVFAAYRHLFNSKDSAGRYKGSIPACLKKGLAAAIARQSAYSLLKYEGAERPTFGDILLMIGGKSIGKFLRNKFGYQGDEFPVSKGLFEYLVNKKIIDSAPEILRIRQQFFATKSVAEVTPEMIKAAGLTWENVLSHLGRSKETWELVIPFMNEMALVRNLRNFEQLSIGQASWDKVYDRLTSVENTHMLPYQFFTASKEIKGTTALSAVDLMLDRACQNVVDLKGVTAIMVDNSGSCSTLAAGSRSHATVSDAGNTLSAVAAKRYGRRAMVGVFGDSFMWVPFSEADSCMAIKRKIDHYAHHEDRAKAGALAISNDWRHGKGVGGGTETGLWCGIQDLIERKVHVDRLIVISDFCCYTQGDANNCGYDMNRYFGKDGDKATIQGMINRYRRLVNKDMHVVSINLRQHGQAQIKDGVQMLSGWSEQIFNLIAGETEEGNPIPAIDQIREKYRLTQQ